MIGTKLLSDNKIDGFFSPGNTGATLVASLMHIKRIKGIKRPGLMTFLPTQKGYAVLMDAGANVDCSSLQLSQFALMAQVFVKHVLHIPHPTVGLLNIGEEANKGNALCLEAFEMMKNLDLNFAGNIEGYDVFNGKVDIIICDGFVGNIVIKLAEGFASFILSSLKKEMTGCLTESVANRSILALQNRLHSESFGAAPILGLQQCVLVGHAKTGKLGMYNAVRMLKDMVDSNIYSIIEEKFQAVNKDQ